MVVSLTNSMTQTHALFLEWFAIGQATQAGRYSLENGNAGARPHTPAPLEADCHEIHETAATLLATLGQPIFEPLTSRRRHHGRAGRRVRLYPRPPVRQPQHGRRGADGPLTNGWVEWKNPQGQTLDEVKRQAVGVAD